MGPSVASEPTRQFQTSQDSPNVPPGEVTLRAVNSTALRISWAVSTLHIHLLNILFYFDEHSIFCTYYIELEF